jgi:hypothetical protein
MSRWTVEIETRDEFLRQVRRCPEMIVVHGRLHDRYGQQSLRTVLDEFDQVYVDNPVAGWCVLLAPRGRKGVSVVASRSGTQRSRLAHVAVLGARERRVAPA